MRGERGLIYGRWYLGYRGLGVVLSLRNMGLGYSREWYDGPIYILSLGPLVLSYLP